MKKKIKLPKRMIKKLNAETKKTNEAKDPEDYIVNVIPFPETEASVEIKAEEVPAEDNNETVVEQPKKEHKINLKEIVDASVDGVVAAYYRAMIAIVTR